MWGQFFFAGLVGLLLLILPGMLILRSFRLGWLQSAILGIPVTVAVAQILFIVYSVLHVRVGLKSFVLPLGLFLVLVCAVVELIAAHRHRAKASVPARTPGSVTRGGAAGGTDHPQMADEGPATGLRGIERAAGMPSSRSLRLWLLGAVALGIVLALLIDVKSLDGPASYSEHYDTAWHYSIVRHFMESGDYSTLHSGRIVPTVGSTFYPTGWHALIALTALLCHTSVALTANAVNAAVLALVYPVTFVVMARWIFSGRPQMWIATSMVSMLFAPTPWRLLSFGPLFSNFLSDAFLPLLLVEGCALFDARTRWADRWKILALFVVTAVSVAVTQPNGIFTAAVILGVYLLFQVPLYLRAAGLRPSRRYAVASVVDILIVMVAGALWYLLYKAPFMQRTVTFNWPNIGGRSDAIGDVLSLGFVHRPQFVLAFVVIVGMAWMLFHRGYRWIVLAYAVLCGLYVVSAGTQGTLKQLLTGFWYTDPYRLASAVVFPAIPIAGAGLWTLWRAALRVFDGAVADFSGASVSRSDARAAGSHTGTVPSDGEAALARRDAGLAVRGAAARQWMAVFLICALVACDVFPAVSFQGVRLEQGLADVTETLRVDNSVSTAGRIYTSSESDFVTRATKIIGRSVVVNQPFDGSCYAYAINGMNVLYKSLDGNWMGAPTKQSSTIMAGMGHVTDPKVAAALRSVGARYVLVLGDDNGYSPDPDAPGWVHNDVVGVRYDLSAWKSLDSLVGKKRIAGMTLVLKSGNNRLYRLDGAQ